MKKVLFIAGTSTDVGKTFVTQKYYQKLSALGECVAIIKPIQTGTEFYNSDIEVIYQHFPHAKRLPSQLEIPFHFKYPASPAAAARYDKVAPVQLNELLNKIHEAIQSPDFDTFLIEAAGGLMVPINDHDLMIDIPQRLDCEVVLVCDSQLGMLNHAMLSIEALERRHIKIKDIVLNRFPKDDHFIAQDNLQELKNRYPHLHIETIFTES